MTTTNIELFRKIAPLDTAASAYFEPNPILPRPEVSTEDQSIYEAKLVAGALLRTRPNPTQDKADEVRKRRQYGTESDKKIA